MTSRDESDMYIFTVRSDVLKAKYSRNQFDNCPQGLFQESGGNRTQTVGLRKAVIH